MLTKTGRRTSGSDMHQMVRITQLYYRMHLSQEQIGERLGLSRFQVGRRLARALREDIVKIEIRHPVARLVELEDALAERFGLRTAVVVDVPTSTLREGGRAARPRGRRRGAAVRFLADLHPSGSIGVSWGRTMLELARQLEPGWTTRQRGRPAERRHLPFGRADACHEIAGAVRRDDRGRDPDARRASDRGQPGAATGTRG